MDGSLDRSMCAKISHDNTNMQEIPKSKTIAPSYQKKKKEKKKESHSFSFISLSSIFGAPSPLSPLLTMLCRIGIEGAKSRCRGRPFLIQIRKSFLTLFLSPCGKELLAWPSTHDWLPKRTICIMALRLIKMQRHLVAICQLFHCKGHLDPQKRDALNKAVEDTTHEDVTNIVLVNPPFFNTTPQRIEILCNT
ncbi:hypothetical protein ACJW30_11G134000 [Castanea mollissima]